ASLRVQVRLPPQCDGGRNRLAVSARAGACPGGVRVADPEGDRQRGGVALGQGGDRRKVWTDGDDRCATGERAESRGEKLSAVGANRLSDREGLRAEAGGEDTEGE